MNRRHRKKSRDDVRRGDAKPHAAAAARSLRGPVMIALSLVLIVAAAIGWWYMPRSEPLPGIDPALLDWQAPRVDVSGMQPQVAAAIRSAREAVERQRQSAGAWGAYGMTLDAHELYPEAERCYRHAAALEPKEVRWPYHLAFVRDVQHAEIDEVVDLYRWAIALAPEYPPAHFRLGDALARRGRHAEAREAFRQAVRLDPDFGMAHRSLAQSLLALNHPEAALRHFTRAAEIMPQDGITQTGLAQVYGRLGRDDEADRTAQRVRAGKLPQVGSVPDPIRFEVEQHAMGTTELSRRAARLMQQGEIEPAIELLNIVLEVQPENASALLRLGEAHEALGETDRAESHYQQAIDLGTDDPRAALSLARLYRAQGRPQRELNVLEEVRSRHAASRDLLFELAMLHAQAERLDRAIELFEEIDELGQADLAVLGNWGTALMLLGRREEAIVRYRAVLEINPNSATAHYNLGIALEETGRPEEAAGHLRRAVELDPGNTAAAERLRELSSRW